MRENRTYGSEGGGTELNRSFLPLSSATGGRTLHMVGTAHRAVAVRLRVYSIGGV
jgi:hypothetical protein